MKINQLVFALMLCCATSAIALPKHAPVPGGIAVIDLGPASQTAPTARWGEQPLAVVRDNGRWFALLGIPLDTLPGDVEISVFSGLTVAPTEHFESLEQLRALWHGYRISVTLIDAAPAPGVDTPEDAERMRKLFDRAGNSE